MRNICSNLKFMNFTLFSNVQFGCLNKLPVRCCYFLNVTCILKDRDFFSGSCIFKYCRVWKQFDNMNYICTGGILLNENSVTEKEERALKLLKEVRFNEHVCTSKHLCLVSTKERTTTLKIMTYNVLSQTLLEEHRYLYRNASPTTLKWEYRYPRILGEISEHNPDILCLQEVQEDHIDIFFNKLEDLGFVGVYKKRTGGKIDGCSIYFKANMFSLVSESKVEYYKAGVRELNRDNVGLVLRLFWWAGNRHVTVANTHLLYNPRRTDVRLAQINVLLSQLNTLTDFGRNNDLVFITGDLNSNPESSVIELITKGYVSNEALRPYWQPLDAESLNKKDTSCNEDEVSLKPSWLAHYFKFKSVHSHWSKNDSEATTFQDRWVTADYIFYSTNDEDLCLYSRLRLPTSKECRKFIKKLPNYASPSDHLPLVATFLLGID